MGEEALFQQDSMFDLYSDDELIDLLLTEDEDRAWRAAGVLQGRGTKDILDAAVRLCQSTALPEKIWGIRVLGQLGIPERAFPDESANTLLDLLARDMTPAIVLAEIAVALGHLHTIRGIAPLARLRRHPDEEVRYGIVYGLLGHEEALAIRTLIELSADDTSRVRDWATFGLGELIDSDSPEIRAALAARVDDEDPATSIEAICGLARRRDERVVEPLIQKLGLVGADSPLVEAASALADTRLLPALLALRDRTSEITTDLEDAINNCSQENRQDEAAR